jgi:hypothetical protein
MQRTNWGGKDRGNCPFFESLFEKIFGVTKQLKTT